MIKGFPSQHLSHSSLENSKYASWWGQIPKALKELKMTQTWLVPPYYTGKLSVKKTDFNKQIAKYFDLVALKVYF